MTKYEIVNQRVEINGLTHEIGAIVDVENDEAKSLMLSGHIIPTDQDGKNLRIEAEEEAAKLREEQNGTI